jgi:hypothetical protein
METIVLVIVVMGLLAVLGIDTIQKRRVYLNEHGAR